MSAEFGGSYTGAGRRAASRAFDRHRSRKALRARRAVAKALHEFFQRWTGSRCCAARLRPEERRQAEALDHSARLAPYIVRYRGRALRRALAALVVAAFTTLLVPVAVRRMIDFGFSDKAVQLIDSYFARDDLGGGRARDLERRCATTW